VNPISQYLLALASLGAVAGCAPSAITASAPSSGVQIVAIERVYGDLAQQLGGNGVNVVTTLNRPSADPHGYEPSTRDADAIANADIVIENGLGYDAFADKLIAASPRAGRDVIDVGAFFHRTGDNPHVWYETATLRRFTTTLAAALEKRSPSTRVSIEKRRAAILAWIANLETRLAAVREAHAGVRVAITEPVFDYLLRAAGLTIATPASFSHAVEEGNDPAPQDVDTMQALLAKGEVAAFVYNSQTVEPATTRLLAIANAAHVHVVPVSETLPGGETTQIWIDAEVGALDRAL
jgi:zinc/manganese transport system substrate-binding protein